MNALEIKGLSKRFNKFQLDDITINIPCGSIMGLIGENGAGKSTIINCILDLVEKDQGEIRIFDQEMTMNNLTIRESIGVVFDVSDTYDNYTLKQIDSILKGVYKQWDSSLFHKLHQQFQLPEKKLMKEYSRGMKMKTAIAIALSHKPKLLILDEATSGLDPVMRDEILDIFLDFVQDEEHAILLSSHISTDLEKVADYITFIHEGKQILSTSKDELIYQYGIMKCRNDLFDQVDSEDILRYRKHPYEVEILVRNREVMAKKYPNNIVDPAKLDNIMLLYVKGEQR